METLSPYEQTLLQGWEEVYKRSQLTLWILMALKDSPKHMALIQQFIAEVTGDSMIADDKSVYRALRRLKDGQMISFTLRAGSKGPDLKQYFLSPTGEHVLSAFWKRNISGVFDSERIHTIINNEEKINVA